MPRLQPPVRASLLALALAAAPLPALADTTAASSATEIQLPAGPLGRSLSTFASQRGIALSFDPALTSGLRAPALRGRHGNRDGLEHLLAGSGLRLVERADGSYGLERAPVAEEGVIALSSLKIGGQRTFPYSEGIVLEQDYIEQTNKGNGDIATLLRINPAVQFADTAQTSRNMGEIRPTDFSINGAPFYQNLFLLDGVGFNNDIDPGNSIYRRGTVIPSHFSDVPSQSQGIALDTDLLESLTVYDSNVPASYGGFSGGVVDAKSRKAGDAFGGKISFRMARSAWDEIIVPEGQERSFEESATYAYQPQYDKSRLGARLEGRTSGGIGMIASVARTRSEIPLRGYTAGNVSDTGQNQKIQTRENTSASLAIDWTGESLELGANITYAPTDDRYFIQNNENAWYDLKSGGPVVGLRAAFERGAWTFRNTVSYSNVESSRRGEAEYFRNWRKSEQFDWGIGTGSTASSIEGSWGDVDQHDRKLGLRATADRDTLEWGGTRHNLQFGLAWQSRKANYARVSDHYNYQQPTPTTSCTLTDGSVDSESCSLSPVLATGLGQYFSRLFFYRAGEFSVRGDEWSTWVQDDIRAGDWSVRPGLRLDGDDIWGETTVSPRLAVSWNILGKDDSVLTAGVNRYYARNFFSYLLREGRERLRVTKDRTGSDVSWDTVEGVISASTNRIRDVDIPHTDEWTVGLDQRWAGLDFTLKYVNRENRDEVLRQQVPSQDADGVYSTRIYEYVNTGRSSSDVYTLTIGLQEPLRWRSSVTQMQFAFDYTDVRRNYTTYESSWDEDLGNELVKYRGHLAWLYDLPAGDYNRPWTARLSTQTRIAVGRGELMWSNFLRYRAGYRDVVLDGAEEHEGVTIDVYADRDNPRSLTWDGVLEYTLDLPRDQQTYIRVEATNLTNRSNRIQGTGTSATYYEPGRSYWLEMGYRF